MTKSPIILFILILSLFEAAAQPKKVGGAWYARQQAYPFRQDGTANIFTRSALPGSPAKLLINADHSYLYQEINGSDTIVTKGTCLLSGDTLLFVKNGADSMQFFLYRLTDTQLIYSLYPSRKKDPDPDGMFERVEVAAFYKPGKDRMLKEIYGALSQNTPANIPVALHEYEIVVLENGALQAETFKALTPGDPYAVSVRNALLGLPGQFGPALQNGRAVKSIWRFTIAY